jgi:hypothetical protein
MRKGRRGESGIAIILFSIHPVDYSLYPILNELDIEVDQQSPSLIGDLQLGQNLFIVNWSNSLD